MTSELGEICINYVHGNILRPHISQGLRTSLSCPLWPDIVSLKRTTLQCKRKNHVAKTPPRTTHQTTQPSTTPKPPSAHWAKQPIYIDIPHSKWFSNCHVDTKHSYCPHVLWKPWKRALTENAFILILLTTLSQATLAYKVGFLTLLSWYYSWLNTRHSSQSE